MKSIDRLSSDRTSIKCHKMYRVNRESLNKRLLPESYFKKNILDLSAIMALANLKPNIIFGHLYIVYDKLYKH